MSLASQASPEISLRAAREDDCGRIRDIYNHYVAHDTCTYALEPETLDERRAWFARHGPRYPVMVAEAEGRVIGWGCLSAYNARAGYRRTVEDSVYLDPAWRGRGIGGRLLAALVAEARALGHHAIIAAISAEQAASVALHERFGFVRVGLLKEVGHKFDRWLDVLYMQLIV